MLARTVVLDAYERGWYGAGTFFVQLRETKTAAGVVMAVARAMGLVDVKTVDDMVPKIFEHVNKFGGGVEPASRLVVVLDNAEDMLGGDERGAFAQLVQRIVKQVPGVCVIVTSRVRAEGLESWCELGAVEVPQMDAAAVLAHVQETMPDQADGAKALLASLELAACSVVPFLALLGQGAKMVAQSG